MTPAKRFPKLRRRYTVETCVYYRVWDGQEKRYIDNLGDSWINYPEHAQEIADIYEAGRR